jgi:hypothetical protein
MPRGGAGERRGPNCASPAEDATRGVVAAEGECQPDLQRSTRSRGEPAEVEAPSGVWKRIYRRGWGRSSCVARAWARISASSGTVKGKCALGLFLSILVIKCPTQVPKVLNCAKDSRSANQD